MGLVEQLGGAVEQRGGNETHMGAAPGVLLAGLLLAGPGCFLSPHLLEAMWEGLAPAGSWTHWGLLGMHIAALTLAVLLMWQSRVLGAGPVARWCFLERPAAGGMLISGLVAVNLALGAEFLFWRLHVAQGRDFGYGIRNYHDPPMSQPDSLLGRRGVSNVVSRHTCIDRRNGATIFEVNYTLQEDGTRRVPVPARAKAPEAHLALFGCSFVFGIGAEDRETFPARIAQEDPSLRVYSFAHPGWGPGQALLQIQSGAMDKVAEPAGAAAYLLIVDHLNRISLNLPHVATFTRNFPAFTLDESGVPRHLGSFSSAYPWRVRLLDLLSSEKFVVWSKVQPSLTPRSEAVALCAGILAQARDEYRSRFPGNEFYVIIDPFTVEYSDIDDLIAALLDRGVPLLSAQGALGPQLWRYQFRLDRHPTPQAWVRLARWFLAQFPEGVRQPPVRQPE